MWQALVGEGCTAAMGPVSFGSQFVPGASAGGTTACVASQSRRRLISRAPFLQCTCSSGRRALARVYCSRRAQHWGAAARRRQPPASSGCGRLVAAMGLLCAGNARSVLPDWGRRRAGVTHAVCDRSWPKRGHLGCMQPYWHSITVGPLWAVNAAHCCAPARRWYLLVCCTCIV